MEGEKNFKEKLREMSKEAREEIPVSLKNLEAILKNVRRRKLKFEGLDYSDERDLELKRIVSKINNASRRLNFGLGFCIIWERDTGVEVSRENYVRAISLLDEAAEILGADVHTEYEKERINNLVCLARDKRPELNQYLANYPQLKHYVEASVA